MLARNKHQRLHDAFEQGFQLGSVSDRSLKVNCDCEWSTHGDPRDAAYGFAFEVGSFEEDLARFEILDLRLASDGRFRGGVVFSYLQKRYEVFQIGRASCRER